MKAWDSLVTFLPAADLDRSHRFYNEVLGLELWLDQGTCRIYRVNDGALVGLCRHIEPRPAAGVITTLVTEDVDGWYERLVGAGAAIEDGPDHNETFGIYHFYVTDPDGNRLEVQRFDSAG